MFKIVGMGGCGVNAVSCMYRKLGEAAATFVVCDADWQRLENSPVPQKFQFELLCSWDKCGWGTGGGAEEMTFPVGRVRGMFADDEAEVVFVIAGMGGGTGSLVAPATGMAAFLEGKFVVGIVTLPFRFEGEKRMDNALKMVAMLKDWGVEELFVIDNDSLAKAYQELTITEAFKAIDEALCEVAEKVMEAITANGINDATFAGVRNTLMDKRIIMDNNKLA